MSYTLKYKGKTYVTEFFEKTTDEFREKIKKEYYAKPDKREVVKQLEGILCRGTAKRDKITRYYVRDILAKTRYDRNKWTIADVFDSPDLFGWAVSRVRQNPQMLPAKYPLSNNIETMIRMGGGSIARKATLFPIPVVKYVLEKYCPANGNYYDYSCGWGDRMLGAFAVGVNYYGTDPNGELVERLKEMYTDCLSIKEGLYADIRPVGSEIFQSDWVGKMDIAFSSPPYFKLEEYEGGEQSTEKYPEYNDWLENFLKKTMTNVRAYLKREGVLAVNVKGYKDFDLVGDAKRICQDLGFEYVEDVVLENIKRKSYKGNIVKNTENIMIFRKVRDD